MFPGVEVLRMDTDTISAVHSHRSCSPGLNRSGSPFWWGTQMVAKGLDFENVTLVGVVAADLSLYVDDYRAAERTFSLITQVVGRAGRGEKTGRALIQTYTPENDVITFAAAQNYDAFSRTGDRPAGAAGLPALPGTLLCSPPRGRRRAPSYRPASGLRRSLEDWLRQPPYEGYRSQLLGPAPAAIAKVNKPPLPPDPEYPK